MPRPAPALLASAALLTLALAARARSAEPPLADAPPAPLARGEPLLGMLSELRIGALSHDVVFPNLRRLRWPDPFQHNTEGGVDLSADLFFASPPLLGILGAPRPRLGGSVNTAGGTDQVHLDLVWDHAFAAGPFVEAFVGGALHDGALAPGRPGAAALGSRALFHLGLELGWRLGGRYGLSVLWEHLSNGNLATPNQGLDGLGPRVGYRFDGPG